MSTVKTTNLQHPSAVSPNLVLAADGSVSGPGSSVIVAVKHALFTGTQTNSTAAGANFAVTDLSITHTLASSSNKLIISAYFGAVGTSADYGQVGLAVADDGTLINVGASPGSRTAVSAGGRVSADGTDFGEVVSMPSVQFVYEPGDTASHTYTVRAINLRPVTVTVFVNRYETDADAAQSPRASSALVIQEVKV